MTGSKGPGLYWAQAPHRGGGYRPCPSSWKRSDSPTAGRGLKTTRRGLVFRGRLPRRVGVGGSLHLGKKHTKGAPPVGPSPGGVQPGAGAKIRDPEGGVSPSAHTPSLGLGVAFHRMTEGFTPSWKETSGTRFLGFREIQYVFSKGETCEHSNPRH